MKTINAIIADDEEHLCTHLQNLLKRLWPDLQILGLAHTGKDALDMINGQEPDIAFLDIKMPLINGIQVAASCKKYCHHVFISAYDNYAIEAFEQNAIDYLLKPVNEDRLVRTIDRLKENIANKHTLDSNTLQILAHINSQLNSKPDNSLKWIRAGINDRTILIPVDDILFFRAEDKYTSVITQEGEFLIRKPIKELDQELDAQIFWKINRGIIVNANHIASTTRELSGQFTLQLKKHPETLTVSRTYAQLFKQM